MDRDPLAQLLGGPDDPVQPRPEFADQLLGQLLIALTQEPTSPQMENNIRTTARSIESPSDRFLPVQVNSRRYWTNPQLVVACLLALLVVSGMWIAVRLNESSEPKTIPAALQASETPAPETVAEESLLDITLPAGSLPSLSTGGSTLFQFTIPAGAEWNWAAKTEEQCCHGLALDYVISGTYSIRFEDDPVQVVRRGGSPETIAAGTEVTLGPGDAVIARLEFGHEGSNSGAGPVQMLRWDFVGTASSALVTPSRWVINADDPHFFLADVGNGPATITLQSVDLQPDQEFQAPAEVRDDLVFAVPMNVLANGTVVSSHVENVGEGRVLNYGSAPASIYVLTLESQINSADDANVESSPAE